MWNNDEVVGVLRIKTTSQNAIKEELQNQRQFRDWSICVYFQNSIFLTHFQCLKTRLRSRITNEQKKFMGRTLLLLIYHKVIFLFGCYCGVVHNVEFALGAYEYQLMRIFKGNQRGVKVLSFRKITLIACIVWLRRIKRGKTKYITQVKAQWTQISRELHITFCTIFKTYKSIFFVIQWIWLQVTKINPLIAIACNPRKNK